MRAVFVTMLFGPSCCYRPQRSCGQGNIFTPVCHSVHRGGSASMHAGIPPPPGSDTTTPPRIRPPWIRHHQPPDQTPPQIRPPRIRHHHPPDQTPPRTRQTPPIRHPPWEADSSIRSTSGRYASYWNAFLFAIFLTSLHVSNQSLPLKNNQIFIQWKITQTHPHPIRIPEKNEYLEKPYWYV